MCEEECATKSWQILKHRPLAHIAVGKFKWMYMVIRGLFKKFCYERLSIRRDNVCLTDFVHKYSSLFHTCTCEISKESSKYQYSYWHLKWPQSYILAYIWRWKGESVELGDVNLHKKLCCDEKFAPKKWWGTNFWEWYRIYAILMHDLVYGSDINSVSKSVTLKEDMRHTLQNTVCWCEF